MKNLMCLGLAIVALLQSAETPAESLPKKGTVDSRVRIAPYSSEQVYRLHGVIGYQIDLQFEAGESFVGLGAGDIEAVSFVGQENHLFLKPKAARVATNLTVLTTRRHYQIEYTVTGGRTGPLDDDIVYALRFSYAQPESQELAKTADQRVSSRLQEASETGNGNTDYWYCGDPSLKPIAASDNGVHTRLRFSAQAELPAIFVRNADDSESLLNFNVADGDVIVHRVARQFVVRRGRLTGCIVNAAFTGGGERLKSGTVAPDVRRETQGAAP
jgi:type IV secretion system protein VirB9